MANFRILPIFLAAFILILFSQNDSDVMGIGHFQVAIFRRSLDTLSKGNKHVQVEVAHPF